MLLNDEGFGLEIERVEARIEAGRTSAARWSSLSSREQHWLGLPPQILLTPYSELQTLLGELALASGSRVVDLGCGYGRLGLVIGRCFPELSFVGYECVPERALEAIRGLELNGFSPRARVELQDLSDPAFAPIEAECYFMYDFGSREAIEKTLDDLRQISSRRPIIVVGRGRSSRDAIERRHPWLSQVVPPRHSKNYSIYRSG